MKILFVAELGNFLGHNWIKGLQNVSNHEVMVLQLSWNNTISEDELIRLGLQPINSGVAPSGSKASLFAFFGKQHPVKEAAVEAIKEFAPDLIITWWGLSVYAAIKNIAVNFPELPVVCCVSSYPNSWHWLLEKLEMIFWRDLASSVKGFIHYSSLMQEKFIIDIPESRHLHHISMIEPICKKSFVSELLPNKNPIPEIPRSDENPRIVFTGRSDLLFSKRFSEKKDALGAFIQKLASNKIHIFIQETSENIESKYIHFLKKGLSVEDGTLGRYLSQFDAHLVMYNEFNSTIKKRVSLGLGTRFAYALTFPCPIIVTETTQFAIDLFRKKKLGFVYHENDFLEHLRDKEQLQDIKSNFKDNAQIFSYEAMSDELNQFLECCVGC
jgi:hypothetical protein